MTDTVNLYDAKTNFSALVDRAARGEEIIIAKRGRPLVRLVAYRRRREPRPFGVLAGQVRLRSDFDELPADVARAFRGEEP